MNSKLENERIRSSEWLECYKHEARGALKLHGIEQPTEQQIATYILYGDKSLNRRRNIKMYFFEQLKPVIIKTYVGKPCFVETTRWEQVAVSEDKRALEEYLNGIVKSRAQRENKSEGSIRKEYKIISNDPNDKNC